MIKQNFAEQQRIAGIARGEVIVGPQTVHFDLANGCNTNCVTCWDHSPLLWNQRTPEWKRVKMELECFERVAAEINSMNSVRSVILSGMGDPFVHPQVYEMIETVKGYGWHTTLLTNALLADPDKILDLGVDSMLISVNGVSPESYCRFHPNLEPSDFARLQEILSAFACAGKRFKHVQVINRDTAGELVEMVRFAHDYRAASITYKLASLSQGTEECAITEEQRGMLLDELVPQAETLARELGIMTNLEVFRIQLEAGGRATAPIAEIGCFMGWYYARITADGRILLCCSTEVEVGHVEQGTFSLQWFGAQWNERRTRLMSGRYFPGCAQCGKVNQNVKIGAKVKEALGESIYYLRTGRDAAGKLLHPMRKLPVIQQRPEAAT
ncbi:MAG: radical SAM protein [Acidobacteria bacterium]|nr:radical SAM protein [Acidobacteriota bacterium]